MISCLTNRIKGIIGLLILVVGLCVGSSVFAIGTGPVVFYHIYGGGGNIGAPYQNDFIVLYNNSTGDIDLTGWQVQNGAATSTLPITGRNITLSGSIAAGGYYLIEITTNTTAGIPLSNHIVPNIVATYTTSAGGIGNNNNKLRLLDNALNVVDFVGFGSTTNEALVGGVVTALGATAPNISNTSSIVRVYNSGSNSTDYVLQSLDCGVHSSAVCLLYINQHVVTFQDRDTSFISSGLVNYGLGAIAPPNPSRIGYMFSGWTPAFSFVTGDMIITAEYIINEYVLNYFASTGGILSGTTTQTINYGATGTMVEAIPSTGYIFSGWSDGSTQNPRIDGSVTTGNTVTAYFIDNSIPVITVIGATGITLNIGDTYTESGAIRTDNGLSGSTLISGTVNTSSTGVYLIVYSYTDPSGNIGSGLRTVTVISPICAPGSELNVSGSVPSCVACDLGTYNPTTGGVCINASTGYYVSTTGSAVQYLCPANTFTDTIGSTSCVSCASGYTSSTGSMVCADTQGPTITLNGLVSLVLEAGTGAYTDSGASWADNADGSGSILTGTWGAVGSFAVSGTVNLSQTGTYYIEYLKVDLAGNASSIVRRTVIVKDTTPPVVTLVGPSVVTLSISEPYVESGARRTDLGASGVAMISGFVDIGNAGTYTIEYFYVDPSGNRATTIRTVTVSVKSKVFGGGVSTTASKSVGSNTKLIDKPIDGVLTQDIQPSIFNDTITDGYCYSRKKTSGIIPSSRLEVSDEFIQGIELLYSYGLTKFDSVDAFEPYRNLTRQQAAKFFSQFAMNVLCRKPSQYTITYSDLDNADPTLIPYIQLAYQLGLMKGGSDGRFRPFDIITKVEFNAVLIRMILKSYLDESGNKWYEAYNQVSSDLGITQQALGDSPVTRYNATLMLFRAYKNNIFALIKDGDPSFALAQKDVFISKFGSTIQ